MHAANTLRQYVPMLLSQYFSGLPDEENHGHEAWYYEDLPDAANKLFDSLLGLCERFRLDRQSEATGRPWRTVPSSEFPANDYDGPF